MGPQSYRLLLGVIALWNSHPEFIIRAFLQTPPRSVLNNKLFVPLIHTAIFSIGVFHNSSADNILLIVLCLICRSGRSFKISLFSLESLLSLLFFYFLTDLNSDLLLHLKSFSAEFSKTVSWINRFTNAVTFRNHRLWIFLSVNSIRCIVKFLGRLWSIIKIQMPFWNMFSHDCSSDTREFP